MTDKTRQTLRAWAHVPDTISKETQELLRLSLVDPSSETPNPAPDDLEGWAKAHARLEARFVPMSEKVVDELGPAITECRYGGVPILDVRPKGWKENGRLIVSIHGGSWVWFSARSMLGTSAQLAEATATRVISVDYTVAPQAQWEQITDQVIAVVQALREEGYPLAKIAIFGDSAGGNIACAATLKMRDAGLGLPAAIVLWSPVTDFANAGDTHTTLRDADPALSYEHGLGAKLAYADRKDWKNPYVSPIYGDFSRGFPPALIQVGTREILLSDSVRLYQAIEAAGGIAKLDVYEGMPHVFQAWWPNAPEGRLAIAKVSAFIAQHLGR